MRNICNLAFGEDMHTLQMRFGFYFFFPDLHVTSIIIIFLLSLQKRFVFDQ